MGKRDYTAVFVLWVELVGSPIALKLFLLLVCYVSLRFMFFAKLANISSESAWNLEDFDGNGEVRLSKYFNAMSEELGTMSSDRPDRPRVGNIHIIA